MKNTAAIGKILFFLLFVLAACSDSDLSENDSKTSASIGESVSRKAGDVTNFENEDGSTLHIKVLSVEDSRCPLDAVCVWEGMVVVKFQIDELKALYSLCLGNLTGCEKSIALSYDGKEYTLELIEVKPYPTTASSGEEKVVVFELKE